MSKWVKDDSAVEWTGNVPICPICKKPTIRTINTSISTCAYYPPIYNNGVNINPNQNICDAIYKCLECNSEYRAIKK